jgi:hypothetical protein
MSLLWLLAIYVRAVPQDVLLYHISTKDCKTWFWASGRGETGFKRGMEYAKIPHIFRLFGRLLGALFAHFAGAFRTFLRCFWDAFGVSHSRQFLPKLG